MEKIGVGSVLLFLFGILSIVIYILIRFFFNIQFMSFLIEGLFTILLLFLFIFVSVAVNIIYAWRWSKGKPLLGAFSIFIKHSKLRVDKLNKFIVVKEYMLLRLDSMPIVVFAYSYLTWWLINPLIFTISFTQAEMLFSIITIAYMISYLIYVFTMGLMLYLDARAKEEENAPISSDEISKMVLGVFK